MDSRLRLAWTEIVAGEDYDEHMAAIGQAEAAAALTAEMVQNAELRAGSRLVVVGAGTGQMFDFMDPELLRPFRLTCTDLNAKFLVRLRERIGRHGLSASILVDDIEHTALRGGPDLLLATLLLEHIDWCKGVAAIGALGPAACGIVIQENPPDMASAVTPGRRLPNSIAAAFEVAQPKLVAQNQLRCAFERHRYCCAVTRTLEVADGKRLVAMLYVRRKVRILSSAE